MIHPVVEKQARLLVDYCTRVQPGDIVVLKVETPALPLARALYRTVLAADATPLLRLSYPEQTLDLLETATDGYFDREPQLEMNEIRQVDAWIRVRAPTNKRALQQADKGRYNRSVQRHQEVQKHRIDHTRWVGTLFPTDAGAQEAGLSLDAFERFVFGAMYLDTDDPAAEWRELRSFQATLIERLSRSDELHIVGPDTDLRLRTAGRTWINSDGRHNMPSGEVFTGPHEASAEGVITFDVPSNVQGMVVERVTLAFEAGKVMEARADEGDDLLQAQLASDEGARYLGEVGIGTNFNIVQPTLNTLFDEKIGGTIHLALGRSYTSTGGRNDSAIHWDLIRDLRREGALYLDGEIFQENGAFR